MKIIKPTRRAFLTTGAGLIASPAIVRAQNIIGGGVYGDVKVSSGPATATWDPTKKGPDQTLSGGNLTVTASGASNFEVVLATRGASAGLKYYEIPTCGFSGFAMIGIANASVTLSGAFLGNTADGVGWFPDGRVFVAGSNVATIDTLAPGQNNSVAIDFTNKNIWFRLESNNWNQNVLANPATNVGGINIGAGSGLNAGPYFPAACTDNSGDTFTANFGASSYIETVPAGAGNF